MSEGQTKVRDAGQGEPKEDEIIRLTFRGQAMDMPAEVTAIVGEIKERAEAKRALEYQASKDRANERDRLHREKVRAVFQ